MSDHRHRRLVEQVAGVNYAAREAGAFTVGSYLFAEREHEVELREAGLRMFRPGPQALECDRGDVVVLDRKRDLEQRAALWHRAASPYSSPPSHGGREWRSSAPPAACP